MATLVPDSKLLVPVYYGDRLYVIRLRAQSSRKRFLKAVKKAIPNLPEGIIILQRYEICNTKSKADKIILERGSEILLLDPEQIDLLDSLNPVSSQELLKKDSEILSVTKAFINSEGAYIDKGPTNLTLQALADEHYYLPVELQQRLLAEYGANALPNARALAAARPVLKNSTDLIWTDVLEEDYIEFMKEALKLFEKLLFAYQASRNERNIRADLYEALFTLTGLHKKAGISGDQKLKLHSGVQMATSRGRDKFARGLKPDLCDGWLFKHSVDENRTWRLVGPHEKLVEGRTGAMLQGQFGEDKFMGIDLLVELKKENKDVDKYKVWLEAIGSLLCFNNDFATKPVIFCGTCSQLDIRFYSVDNAEEADKDRLSKRPSLSKQMQTSGSQAALDIPSRDDVKFVVRNLFSLTIVDIDSFLQFAMFLWRVKQFRRKQFDIWATTLNQQQRDFDIFSFKKPLSLVQNSPATNNNLRNAPNAATGRNNTNTDIESFEAGDEEDDQEVENLFPQVNFEALQRLRQNICMEIWRGKINGLDAYLKANIGINDVANERSIYLLLQGKGFAHMPKLLGAYTDEYRDIIVIQKVHGKHVERLQSQQEVTLYAYKLLKILEALHALNVVHGDIKPSNILYDPRNKSPHDLTNMKLIDFGFAQVLDDVFEKNRIRGFSYGYSSPELVHTDTITLSDDIYSAGIIIGQLICGYDVHDFNAHDEITKKIQHADIPFGSEGLSSLVMQMILPRAERPSASQLLEHSTFKELLDSPFSSDEEMKFDN